MAKKNTKSTTSGGGNNGGNPTHTEQIPYDPNQEVSLSVDTKLGEEWGNVESKAELVTCQETFRQATENLLVKQQSSSTSIVDTTGINETGSQNVNFADTTISSEQNEAAPAEMITPAVNETGSSEGEVGIPTGFEDRIKEQISSTLNEVKSILQEGFDIEVTIKDTEDGRTIRFKSNPEMRSEGQPTSAEDNPEVEFFTDTEVDVKLASTRQSGENMVSLVADVGGQPVRLLSVSQAGRPTAGDGQSNSTVNQAKIENKQTGLINNQAGVFNVSIAIGNILNVQV